MHSCWRLWPLGGLPGRNCLQLIRVVSPCAMPVPIPLARVKEKPHAGGLSLPTLWVWLPLDEYHPAWRELPSR